MSSGKRSKRSDRNRYYRDGYDDAANGGSGVYTRSYAPWQWGYWAGDNMAYAGKEEFYGIQDDRSRGRGHYAGNMYDNAGYHGYKHGRGGGSYKLKTSSNSDGFSEYPGEGSDKSSRRCCVVMAVVGTMFLLGAGLAIGIYFGVVDKPESLREPAEPTTTVAPAQALVVDMTLTIDRNFNQDLNDPDSQTYKDLETEVKDEIDTNMNSGPLGDSFSETEVVGFSEGSTIALTKLKFKTAKVVENNVDVEITATKVVTELKVQLTQSNSVLFEKETITAKKSTAVGNVGLSKRCASPSDCSVPYSICTGSPSVCQCDTGYFDNNGKKRFCVAEKKFGRPCSQKTDCKTIDAECIGTPKVCGCITGTYHNTQNNACKQKIVNGGSGCENAPLQCLVPGAACINGKCDCEAGYQLKDNNCTKLIEHGESGCSVDSDCITPNAICAINECTCTPANYYSTLKKVCEAKKDNGASCDDKKECRITGATCTNTVCGCPLGTFLNDDTCSPQVTHDATCVGNKQNECATQDAVCDQTSKKCKCTEAKYLKGNKCDDKIPYKGLCTKADHCLTTDAVCPSTTCVCEAGFYHDTDSNACMKIKDFDQDCTLDIQCLTDAKCTDGKCACPIDMYQTKDRCSKKKDNKESCDNKEQCLFDNAKCVDVCQCPEGRFENEEKCDLQVGDGNSCKGLPNECLIRDAVCDGTDEICQCPENTFLNNEVCSEKTGNGQKCLQNVECKYENAICVTEFCTCPPGTFGDDANEICKPKVGQNEACSSDNMCKFEGAKCGDEKCVCSVGTFVEGEACKEQKAHGVKCEDVSQCATKFSICAGTQKVCTCDTGFYHAADTDECMAVKGFDEDCSADDMCSMNIECISNKCACRTGFYQDTNKCSETKPNQVACSDSKECAVKDAVCDKICKCSSGTYEDGLFCKDQVDYEAECSVTAACKTKSSECKTATKTCLCPNTMFRDTNTDTCKDKTGDGEACSGDNECSFTDAVCSSSFCACPEGKFVNNKDKRCDDKKSIGEDCEVNDECVDTSICDAKKCACPTTSFEKDGACTDKIPDGGYCDSMAECEAKNAVCKENVCTCEDKDYLKDKECMTKKANDVECEDYNECSNKDAICDQTCKCPDQYKLIDTTCMQLLPHDSECSDVQLCMTTGSVCAGDQTKTCTCADDKYHNSVSDSCELLLEHEAAGCVDADLQCKTENAACVDGKCSCAIATYYSDGKCLPGQENGEACVTDSWCKITDAVCDTICKCETGFYSDGFSCVETIPYDSPCTPDKQCKTTDGVCVMNKCGCNENYFYHSDEDKCMLKLSYNSTCSDKSECITQDAECLNSKCHCSDKTFFSGVSCDDTKDIGEICEGDEECRIEGSLCNNFECQCLDDSYYDVSCKKKVGLDETCGDSSHCAFTNATCASNKCACATGTYASGTSCMSVKSYGAQCSSGDECKTQICSVNKCSCLTTQFFDNDVCNPKVDYNGACSLSDQCSTESVECSAGTCLCSSDFFFNSEKNACFINIGGTCETADECSTTNAECLSKACTCGTEQFIDLNANSCEDKKGYGLLCISEDECIDGFMCDGVCTCDTNTYFSGTSCMERKFNGFPCETVEECSVTGAQCIDKTCKCSTKMFLSNNACVNRLSFGQTCEASDNCMEMFVCTDSTCSCQEGYMYDDETSNCTMVVTTTAIPTTMAPDEVVVITSEGQLVSNETYNPEYADENSEAYKQKVAEIEESLSDPTDNTTLKVKNMTEGSLIIIFEVTIIKTEITNEVDTTEDLPVGEITQKIDQLIIIKVKQLLNKGAVKLEEKKVLKDVKVPEAAVKIIKEPCKDDDLKVKRAFKDICSLSLKKLQQVKDNPSKRCSAYLNLLTCIALQYVMEDTQCAWNNFRTNFEENVVTKRDLAVQDINFKPCVKGNFFNFELIGGVVSAQEPCKDLTAMKIVAESECNEYYNIIKAEKRKSVCNVYLDLEMCVTTVMKRQYENNYLSCKDDTYSSSLRGAIIYNEVNFFESKQVALEKCEFCTWANVFHIFKTKCSRSMKSMASVTSEEACGMLHQEIQCIETHLKEWSENHKCTMDNIKIMFKTEDIFLEYGQEYLSWLDRSSMDECLAAEMKHWGPSEPETICSNQNYIYYVLRFSRCYENILEAATGGCFSLYQAVDCVREEMEKEGKKCSYKELEKSILKNEPVNNSISSVLSKEPIQDCILESAENVCQSSINLMAHYRGKEIVDTCLYNLLSVLYLDEPQFIKPYNSNKGSLACNILDESALCTYAIFASTSTNWSCTPEHAYSYIKEILPEFVNGMIKAYENPDERRKYNGSIFTNYCKGDSGSMDDVDCKEESTVIHSLTAACAPLVMHAEENRCQTFEECVNGAKGWHENIPICPGYIDTLERGQYNQDLANYFYKQSGFQWMSCFEESYPIDFVLGFPNDPFIVDYYQLNSDASQEYIEKKTQLLEEHITLGRHVFISALGPLSERRKRQTGQQGNTGTEMTGTVNGPRYFEEMMKTNIQNLPVSQRMNFIIKSTTTKDGSHAGKCPAIEAYDKVCGGFFSQCLNDSDCNSTQKCCNDGKADFCVNSVTQAVEYMVELTLNEVDASDEKATIEENLKSYRTIIGKLFEDFTDHSLLNRSMNKENKVVLIYKVIAYQNPKSAIKKELKDVEQISLSTSVFVSKNYEVKDHCPKELLIVNNILKCINDEFIDERMGYQDYEICRAVSDLASCVTSKCSNGNGNVSGCEIKDIQMKIMAETDSILKKVNMQNFGNGTALRISTMMKEFSMEKCAGMSYDVNPCYSEDVLKNVTSECKDILQSVNPADPFSVDFCSTFNRLSSCMIVKLRRRGAQWCDSYQIKDNLLNILKLPPYSYVLPTYNERCDDKEKPLCTFSALQELSWSQCKLRPYIYKGSCSNETVREVAADFVACIRIQSLRDKNDCQVNDILDILKEDRYHLDLIGQGENVDDCFTEETLDAIRNEFESKADVCNSGRAMKYFYHECFDDECILKLQLINDDTARCTMLYQQVSCIGNNMRNESFECTELQLMDTAADLTDKSLPITLSKDLSESCKTKMEENSMKTCKIPLLSRINGSKECVDHLLPDLSKFNEDQQCKLVSVGGSCLSAVAKQVDATCEDDVIPSVLDDIIAASSVAMRHLECKYEDNKPKSFDNCDVDVTINLCDTSEVDTMINLIKLHCDQMLKDAEREHMKLITDYKIDEQTLICSGLNMLTTCGVETTKKIHIACEMPYVKQALIDNQEKLANTLTGKDIQFCAKDECQIEITAQIKKCLPEYIRYELYGDWTCSIYNVLHHCVKVGLSENTCSDDQIKDHLFINLYQPNYDNAFTKCKVEGKNPFVCTDIEMLNKLANSVCRTHIYNLTQDKSCSETNKKTAIDCLTNLIPLYDSTCDETEVQKQAKIALLYISKNYGDNNIKDCFPEMVRDGFCPLQQVQQANSYCRVCEGVNQDMNYGECTSDIQCDGESKCCHDGCKMTCIAPAKDPITLQTTLLMMNVKWDEAYKNPESEKRKEYIEVLENLMVHLGDKVETTSPAFNLSKSYPSNWTSINFTYKSFVTPDEMKTLLGKYIEDEELQINILHIAYSLYDGVDVEVMKEGTCPRFSLELLGNNYMQHCCNDFSCNDDKKCCQLSIYQKTCVSPVKETLKDCGDADVLDAALRKCDLDLTKITSYNCSELFGEKMKCVLAEINDGRTSFTQCDMESLRLNINRTIPEEDNTVAVRKKLFSCRLLQVTIVVEPAMCDINTPAFNAYKERLTDALAKLGVVEKKQEFCRYQKYRTIIRFSTDEDQYTVQYDIYYDLNTNMRRKRQTNETNELKADVTVYSVDERKLYLCEDVQVSKEIGLMCFEEKNRYNDEEYKKCGFVFDFFECYKNKFSHMSILNTESSCELSDTMLRDEVIPYIEEKELTSNNYDQNIEKLKAYDSNICYDRYIDINPCNDDEKRQEAFSDCLEDIPFPNTLSLSDSENCRKFYDLSYCVASKLRNLGSKCNFYAIEQYTVERLMDERNIVENIYNWTCTRHEPVCSARYIMNGVHNSKCMKNALVYARSFNCSSDSEKMDFVEFVQCLAIDGLYKKERDCTVSKIMDMIRNDKYNLELVRGSDIDTCLSVEEQSELELDFTYGENLCQSEKFVEYVTPNCSMRNDSRDVTWACSQSSDIEDVDTSDASCSYLTQVMSCVKENIMENIELDCKMADLVGMNIQVNSMPLLSEEENDMCISKLEDWTCLQRELSKNTKAALQCVKIGKYSMDQFLDDNDDTDNDDDDENNIPCSMLEYTLICLRSLISETCSGFTEEDLYMQYTRLMEYIEMDRSLTECYQYKGLMLPQNCDIPNSVLEDTNDCDDADFVTNVVIGYCRKELMDNSTDMEKDDAIKCLHYPALLTCGMEVTKKFHSVRVQDGKEEIGCEREQIHSALQSKADDVEEFLSLKLEDCQGECYLDIEPVVTECVQKTLGANSHGNTSYMYNNWQEGCRAYKYAYQCVHLEKPGCDVDLKKAVLDSVIAKRGRNMFSYCKNPANEAELDVCRNVTDLFELTAGHCGRQIKALLNTTGATQQNQGNCKNQTELNICMEDFLRTYKMATPGQEICGEKTNEVIGKVAMAFVRKDFRYDDGSMEMNLATVKNCFGFDERNGQCPYVNASRNQYTQEFITCVIDEDCTRDGDKCCYNGPTFSCRSPSTIKAKFEVKIKLLKVDWNNETENMVKPHLQMIQDFCDEMGWECEEFSFSPEKIYRRKRQTSPMSSWKTIITFIVESIGDPARIFSQFIQKEGKIDLYKVTSRPIEDRPPFEKCQDVETVYDSMVDDCYDDVRKVFNSDNKMSYSEKCLVYKDLKTCAMKSLYDCEERELEMFIDDKLYDIYNIFKRKEIIDEGSEFLDVKSCQNDVCMSEDYVLNVTLGVCMKNLTTLSGKSELGAMDCMNVLSLTKCVSDFLQKISMRKCNKGDTENLIVNVMRSDRFQRIAKNMSLDFSMIKLDMCKEKVCHPQRMAKYAKDECSEAFEAYMKEENCVHVQMISGCVKFQAFTTPDMNNMCSFMNVTFVLKHWIDEIISNSDIEVPSNLTRSFDWCPDENMTTSEMMFPKSPADICGYSGVNHHHVRYKCMSNMPAMFLSDEDQCLYKEYLTGCLNETMAEFGCHFNDSKKAISMPDTLSGLLKTDLDCQSVIAGLTHCDRHLLNVGKSVTDHCLMPMISFATYRIYNITSVDVDTYKAPENEQKLFKCSLLEEVTSCIRHKRPYIGTEDECTAESFKKIINTEVVLYQKVARHSLDPFGYEKFTPVDFKTCTLPETIDANYDVCPENEDVVKLLVSVCAPRLALTKMMYPQIIGQPCMLSNIMTECYKTTEIPRLEKCDNDRKSEALTEFDEDLPLFTDGFNFKQCSDGPPFEKCQDVETVYDSMVDDCYDDVRKVFNSDNKMSYSEKCLVYKDLKNCAMKSLYDCEERELEMFIDDKLYDIYNIFKRKEIIDEGSEFPDVKSCQNDVCMSEDYVLNVTLGVCMKNLTTLSGKSELGAMDCMNVLSLTKCVSDFLQKISMRKCNKGDTENLIVNVMRSDRFQRIAKNMSLDFSMIKLDMCKEKVCHPQRMAKYAKDECSEAFEAYMKEENCVHVQMISGCVKFQAFTTPDMNNMCSFMNVTFVLKHWIDEIISNSDIEVPSNLTRSFDWCPDENMTTSEMMFPKSPADICGYSGVNHHHVRYKCMSNMPAMFLSDEDQCLYKEYLTGCLNETMAEFGCHFNDSKKAISMPETLSGLLKTDLDCKSVIAGLTHCDRHLLNVGKSLTDHCLMPMISFATYRIYNITSVDVDTVKTPENEQKLFKCSLLEEVTSCIRHKRPYIGTEDECTAESFKKIINTEVVLYQKVARHSLDPVGYENFTPVDFKTCTLPETIDVNYDVCPENEDVVKLLVSVCAPRLALTKMMYPQIIGQPCMLSNIMTECYKTTEIPRLEKCDNDRKSEALTEFDEDLPLFTDGFNFKQCSGSANCYQLFDLHGYCSAKYASLHLIDWYMNDQQTCTLLSHYRAKTIKCYEDTNVGCGKYADEYLKSRVDLRDELVNAFPDSDTCIVTYEVALGLPEEVFQEDYTKQESVAYQDLLRRSENKVNELLQETDFTIEGASELVPHRMKRQTEPEETKTILHIIIKAGIVNPKIRLQEILASNIELQNYFHILSSKLQEDDLCSGKEQIGLMECGDSLNDPNVNCLFRGCFANLSLPEECTKDDDNRQELADDVFSKIKQESLGTCEKYDPSPCGPNYFLEAITDECEDSWKDYNESNNCHDYQDFLTCIGIMARVKGQNCSLESIHMNISKQVQERQLDAKICNNFADLKMANSSRDICKNGLTNAYFLKRYCLDKNYLTDDIADADDKCMMEMKMQYCLFSLTSSFARCHNFSETVMAFKSAEVKNVLNNQETKCDKDSCQRHVIMDFGQTIRQTCLQNTRSILYLPDVLSTPSYGNQGYSFPCLVYMDAARCMGLFEPLATNGSKCTKEEYNNVMKENLLDLIEIMVTEGHFMGMPDPRNSVEDVYSECAETVSQEPLPTVEDCKSDEQIVNTLTASCSVHAMGIVGEAKTVSDKCRGLSSCTNGIFDWYKIFPVCDGFIEAFKAGQQNEQYAEYFENVTGLNWFECDFDDGKDSDDSEDNDYENECPYIKEDEFCPNSECEEDEECGDQICCKTSCGRSKCVDKSDDTKLPPTVFRISLNLKTRPFINDYHNLDSNASMALIKDVEIWLQMLIYDKDWKIERFLPRSEGSRLKRRVAEGTIAVVSVYSLENPDELIKTRIIERNLSSELDLISSQAQVDCSAVSCFVPDCRYGELYTPEGDCCPQCKPGPSPCTPEYFDRAVNEDCSSPWSRYIDNNTCRHYAAFVSCGWYHGLARNISCNLTQADQAVREQTLNQDDSELPARFCTSSDDEEVLTFEYVQNALPKNRTDICENVFVNRILLDYYCLDKPIYYAMENEGKCLYEFGMRQCVNRILSSDFRCNISSTNKVFQNETFRTGLLSTKTELNCDTKYPCAKYLMAGIGGKVIDSCTNLASNILHISDIDNKYLGGQLFKCLTYKFSTQCAIFELESADPEFRNYCPNDGDIHSPFIALIDMKANEDDEMEPKYDTADFFQECITNSTIEQMNDCLEQGEEMITLVTAACASEVDNTLMEEPSMAAGCRALHGCYRGIAEMYMSKSLCEGENLMERFEENTRNDDFVVLFNSVTDLKTQDCQQPMKTYEVTLLFAKRNYTDGFDNMDSSKSKEFIEDITTNVLGELFENKSVNILKLSRPRMYKRQDEPEYRPSGVLVLTKVDAFELNGKMLIDALNKFEGEVELESIYPVYLPCLPHQESTNCFRDPCDDMSCDKYPDARCVSNYCDGCNAFLYDKTGEDITEQCESKGKPGQCPTIPKDSFGTCEVECSNDDDCNDNQKCCDGPCGFGHCFIPVYEFTVKMMLLNETFRKEYMDLKSNASMNLTRKIMPELKMLIPPQKLWSYEIEEFMESNSTPDRRKRQVSDNLPVEPKTIVILSVKADKNPGEMIMETINDNTTLAKLFLLISSEENDDECAMVKCEDVTSFCPKERIRRVGCCDVCEECACEEQKCNNPQPPKEGECCPVCPQECTTITAIGMASEFGNIADERFDMQVKCRIYVNTTLMVMDKTMGNYSVETVGECLLTKLKQETDNITLVDSLGSCVENYYQSFEIFVTLNYPWNKNYTNATSNEYVQKKYELINQVKNSAYEIQQTYNMFVLVKKFEYIKNEDDPTSSQTAAYIELLVAKDSTEPWPQLEKELLKNDIITGVKLMEDDDKSEEGHPETPPTTPPTTTKVAPPL